VPLGTLLVREGALTPEQLEEALVEKDATGHRVGEIVVARGWVTPGDVARLLAEQHDLEYLDLATASIEPEVAQAACTAAGPDSPAASRSTR